MSEYLIVAGDEPFVKFVLERGICPRGTRVRFSVRVEDVQGKHVVCNHLPLHLAAAAKIVTTIVAEPPPWIRQRNMTMEQWREYAVRVETYETVQTNSQTVPVGKDD